MKRGSHNRNGTFLYNRWKSFPLLNWYCFYGLGNLLLFFLSTACKELNGQESKNSQYHVGAFAFQNPRFGILVDSSSILGNLEAINKQWGEYPDSIMLVSLRNSLMASRKINYQYGTARSLIFLGYLYREYYHNFDSAFVFLREAESLTTSSNAVKVMVNEGLAQQFLRNGQYDSSLYYWQRALFIVQNNHSAALQKAEGRIYHGIAKVWGIHENRKKSLEFLQKGERATEKYGDRGEYMKILCNKIAILTQLEKYDEALVICNKLIKHGSIDTSSLSSIYENMGSIAFSQKDTTQTVFYFYKAYFLAQKINEIKARGERLAAVTLKLGWVHLFRKEYEIAENFLKEAARLSTIYDYKPIRKKAYELLASVADGKQDFTKASTYRDSLVKIIDEISPPQTNENMSDIDTRYRLHEKENVIASINVRLANQRSWIIAISSSTIILLGLTIGLLRRKRHQEQLAQLKAMIQGEEQERNRIARDLHDGIGGMLAAVKIGINNLEKNPDGTYLPQGMPNVIHLLDNTSQEVRRTAHHLMPEVLAKNSFPQALRSYCDPVQTDTGLQIILQFHTPWMRLNPNMELSLYRIMQELLHNVIRHAKANIVSIQFRQEGHRLHITVEDDGKGFDPALSDQGMGLSNIRSRINLWQGHLSIESVIGHGSTFYMELPLKQNYAYEDRS